MDRFLICAAYYLGRVALPQRAVVEGLPQAEPGGEHGLQARTHVRGAQAQRGAGRGGSAAVG